MEHFLNIPPEIHNIAALSLSERYILALIYNLSKERPCTMSNPQMASNLNVAERSVIRTINRLKEKGYIRIERPSTTKRLIYVHLSPVKVSPCQSVTMTNCHHDKLSVAPCQSVTPNHDKLSPKNIYKIYKNNNYIIGVGDSMKDSGDCSTLLQEYRDKVKDWGGSVSSSDLEEVKALYNAYGYDLSSRAILEAYKQDDIKDFESMNNMCADWVKEQNIQEGGGNVPDWGGSDIKTRAAPE